jgi:magnesium-transporting ATPase (P-type)
LPLVLLFSGLLALAFGKIVDGVVVVAVVFLNSLVGAVQEHHAGSAIDALVGLVPEFVTALRDGYTCSVPAAEIVPADIVLLEAGDRVPADVRLIRVRDCRVNEAALTGESVPSMKQSEPVRRDASLGDRTCMLFSGTMLASGTATGVVVATGLNTELGRMSAMLRETVEIETPLGQALSRFGAILTSLIGGVAYFVLLVALRRGYPIVEAVRSAVSLVVAAVPSSLPAIMTVTLAVAVSRMAKRNAIVRTLPAIETLGSTSVICSDKTGTLTRGEMVTRALWTSSGLYELSGAGYVPRGELWRSGERVTDVPSDIADLLLAAVLCNDAGLRSLDGTWVGVGDPTEVALVVAAAKLGVNAQQARVHAARLDVLPFDSAQKYMATLHRLPDNAELVLMKGAPEVILGRCGARGREGALDPARASAVAEALAAHGMRVLGVASLRRSSGLGNLQPATLGELRFLGFAASLDPPRPEAISAIAECHRSGIVVKMVTGDHPATAKAIGIEIGLATARDRVVVGSELDAMSDEQIEVAARSVNVFSRVAPEHKLRLVRALQRRSEVVAMTGDGVNDAPALKQADVGVAMGSSGTAAAKEAAAVVLVDDNFASIAAAVEGGRRCYDNLVKALLFVVPTNLGQSLALLFGVLLFPVVEGVPLLPIVPLQILWVNLVTGVTLAIPLAFEAPEPDLMERAPRPRGEPIFTPQLALRSIVVGALMALGALILFLKSYYGEIVIPHASAEFPLRKAQTIVATTIVLFQVFYLLQCRSQRTPAFALNPLSNPALCLGIAATVLLQIAFVYAPAMNVVFRSVPLRAADWIVSCAVASTVLPAITLQKMLYEKRVHSACRPRPPDPGGP